MFLLQNLRRNYTGDSRYVAFRKNLQYMKIVVPSYISQKLEIMTRDL